MLADPASPDVKGYDDDGDGTKDENDEKYPLDGVIDGPGENGNADNEWDIAEGALITLDGSGSSDPGGTLAAAAHDWTRVYITTPVTGYVTDPTASLPDTTAEVKMISTDEDLKMDAATVAARSAEVMTPLVAANPADSTATGRLAAPFYVYYRLTVTDSSEATNSKIVKLVIHDQPADPVIDSIVPMANTDTATGAAGSKISCQTGVTGTGCETGAPGSGRYIIAPRSAITLTPMVAPARAAIPSVTAVWDADGDTPTVTWEGATDTDPSSNVAPARFTAPASAEDGDEFTVTATATDVTGRTSSKSVTLVVATNTAPDAVAPGTLAPTQLFSSIVVNDGPDGGDIDPLTKRGTGRVKLRGIGHDPDGGSLVHVWTELALAPNATPDSDATTNDTVVLPTLDTSTTPPSLDRATSVRPIRLPAKPLVTIDGAFSQDASFQVPEVNARHTKIDITEAAIGVDLNADGDATDADAVTVVAVPIAYTVLDEHQVKTTKIVIVFIRDTDDVPRANAGPNQQVAPGSFVRLNGGASSDADPGDRLAYKWTYVGIVTDPKTEDRTAITAAERGYGFVEGKWFPYDGKDAEGEDVTDDDDGLAGDQTRGDYHPTAGGALKNEGTAFPYFDAPRIGSFNSIKLTFELVVTDGQATTTDATDDNASQPKRVTITITDGFYSEQVTGPGFCLSRSLGGPRTYAFDSDLDGVADVCSLSTTRRATVARQNALESLAALNPETFKDHLHGKAAVIDDNDTPDDDADDTVTAAAIASQCAAAPTNLGDDDADLAADSCGRVGSANRAVSAPPRPVDPVKAAEFFSGAIDGPHFCANRSLGGPVTYALDSDGDGVADVCSLPYTRREAVARQNALEQGFGGHAQYNQALKAACAALGTTAFEGDSPTDLAKDECSRPPTGASQGTALPTKDN